jgi:hypothetical protein
MVHGRPFEGFQKIPHISVSITCHCNLRTGRLGKSIASPFTEILPHIRPAFSSCIWRIEKHSSEIPASKVQELDANRKVDEPLNNNNHRLTTQELPFEPGRP